MSGYHVHVVSGVAWPDAACEAMGHVGEDIRPVVVLDPEDAEKVKLLATAIWAHNDVRTRHERFLEQFARDLREFANPTPPKPAEPTGLGAVVEDAQGARWINAPVDADTDIDCPWLCLGPSRHHEGSWERWATVNAVRVLSEGVTA